MAKDKNPVIMVGPSGPLPPDLINAISGPITYVNPLADVHFVGLKKMAPMRYAVVTGTLGSPIVDTVSQPLEYAAEAAKLAWHKLLDVVPLVLAVVGVMIGTASQIS